MNRCSSRSALAALALLATIGGSTFALRHAATAASGATETFPEVTGARLLAQSDDGWLMFLRSYQSQGHAPFTQINTRNVARLSEVFTHGVSIPEGFEAPPSVNGRTMIVTTPLDHVYALDAVTGKELWTYDYDLPKQALRTVCCDMVNRGVALYGTSAYMATLDDHVLALDALSGKFCGIHGSTRRRAWDTR